MEKAAIVKSILETVELEISDFVESESSIICPIEYENRVIEIARSFAQDLISKSQGKLPGSRNGKKKYWLQ